MFDKLQQASRLNDSGAFPYLRTHPMTTERAADMQSRQQLAARPPIVPTLQHLLVAARARALSQAGVDAQRGLVAEAQASATSGQPSPRLAASVYAGALAASRLRDHDVAARLAARLRPLVQGDAAAERMARLLGAELALAAGAPARALEEIGPITGTQRPELLLGAQALVRTGRAAEAAQALQTWVSVQPRDAGAWQQLALAHAAQGQRVRAVRAEAEVQVAQLDYAAALDRFKAAQDLLRTPGAGDHIEASIIDTRARHVQSLLREQALER